MLTAFGVGEVAISLSAAAGGDGPLEHTVRDVGPVTHALCTPIGGVVGVRGPFGTDWGVGDDVLRPATTSWSSPAASASRPCGALASTSSAGAARRGPRLFVLVGARTPDQVVFGDELASWRDAGAEVAVTVDAGRPGWTGRVGLVTTLLARRRFDPARTVAWSAGRRS